MPKTKTTIEEVNAAVQKYAHESLKGILAVNSDPCVSIDFNHDSHSSVFDLNGTRVMDDGMVRVMSWYDNEWGFSCRMLDTAMKMHKVGY
jgi:glyceraldehyde 3-phosphate dehydrogenase